MSQLGKLYSFYLKKIFTKNWLRITFVALGVAVVWFGLPLLAKKYFIDVSKESRSQHQNRGGRFENSSFRELNEDILVTYTAFREENRVDLEQAINQLKTETDEKKKEAIHNKISILEADDKINIANVFNFHYNADNAFFFSKSTDYWKGKKFWKLLNDISWWNLTGFIVLFFLIFNIADSTFFDPVKDGEEVMVLNFTPGVKRSDIFLAKVLAFLTFYSLANVLLFLLPFGFYYFWVAKTSFSGFVLLTLWTTVIGPILFFGLILTPYLFVKSTISWLAWIISALVAFSPQLWFAVKNVAFRTAHWPYRAEELFFDPIIFTIISLVCGIIFLSLYYWRYQEQDLSN